MPPAAMRTGIFGGTFDPPHLAHLILADEACQQLGLHRLLWVLTADPPHKHDRRISALGDRLAMLEAAIAGNTGFELSRVDIDRPPPHYALDTVRLLRLLHPESEMVYLMGGDSLRDLPTWHEPQRFVAACDLLAVARRPGDRVDLQALEAAIPGVTAKVRFVDAPLLEISSTEIRRRAATGLPFRYFLLPSVYAVVLQRGLYTHPPIP